MAPRMNDGPITDAANELGWTMTRLAHELGYSDRQLRFINGGHQEPTMPLRKALHRLVGRDVFETTPPVLDGQLGLFTDPDKVER